ncbi:MAG: response regulator transcription factor [Planctomycetota bacterium]|jgi:FixJ family two-component response regulator
MKTSNDRHIFLVDDGAKVRQVVEEILEQDGLHTSCFRCPTECLEQLPAQRCDLLITDLRLPEMDGVELLRRARVVVPWLPVLVITGYGDIPEAVRAIRAGADDFIEKPVNKQDFLKSVKALLPENGKHRHLGKPLTPTEQRVLRLVIDGKSNKETANLLNRSVRTVEVHRAHVMRKLGADNLVDLLKRAAVMGLVKMSSI